MSRQTVVDMAMNAYRLNDCLSAEEALTRWLAAHPQDIGLHELAGQVGIVKAAAMERAATGAKTIARPLWQRRGGDAGSSDGEDDFARTDFTRSNL